MCMYFSVHNYYRTCTYGEHYTDICNFGKMLIRKKMQFVGPKKIDKILASGKMWSKCKIYLHPDFFPVEFKGGGNTKIANCGKFWQNWKKMQKDNKKALVFLFLLFEPLSECPEYSLHRQFSRSIGKMQENKKNADNYGKLQKFRKTAEIAGKCRSIPPWHIRVPPPPQGNWPPEWQRIQSRDEMGLRTGCMGICIAAKGDNQEVRVQPHRGGAGTHERLCAQTHSQCICMHTQTNGHTQQQIIGEMKFWVWALSFLNRHSSPPKRDKSKNSLLKPPKLDKGWKDIHMNYILCFIIMHLITHPNHWHCVYYDCFLLTYDQTILVNQEILVKSLKWYRKKLLGVSLMVQKFGQLLSAQFHPKHVKHPQSPSPLCLGVGTHPLPCPITWRHRNRLDDGMRWHDAGFRQLDPFIVVQKR